MFPMGLVLLTTLALLCSALLCLCGLITGGALALCWVMSFAVLLGLLFLRDDHHTPRRVGAGLLAAVALGLALLIGLTPAHASAAADLVWHGRGLASDILPVSDAPVLLAPSGDTGLWAWVNGWIAEGVAAIVAGALTWALKEIATHTRIKIRADQEEQLRQTALTGVYAGIQELELQIDQHWTPAERQKVIDKGAQWLQIRAAAQLKALGLPDFVARAIVGKVLGQVLATHPVLDAGDIGLDLGAVTGNPGSTPALDRAAGAQTGGR